MLKIVSQTRFKMSYFTFFLMLSSVQIFFSVNREKPQGIVNMTEKEVELN